MFVAPALLDTLHEALKSGYELPSQRIILMCQPSEKPVGTPYRCIEEIWGKAARARQIISEEEKNTAYLCYSSGTTGAAKGVETSHHNMTSQIQALRTVYQPLKYGDVILGMLPFGHIYGLTCLLHHPLTVHAAVVILPKFNVQNVLKTIDKVRYGIRGIS